MNDESILKVIFVVGLLCMAGWMLGVRECLPEKLLGIVSYNNEFLTVEF